MARTAGTTNKNSWNAWLMTFELGQREYVECSLEDYPQTMRTINTPLSRRPAEMGDKRFTTTLFTAVSASKAGDIRYLICVERIQ